MVLNVCLSSALQCKLFNFAWERYYSLVFNCIKSMYVCISDQFVFFQL